MNASVVEKGYISYLTFLSVTLPAESRRSEPLCRVTFDTLDRGGRRAGARAREHDRGRSPPEWGGDNYHDTSLHLSGFIRAPGIVRRPMPDRRSRNPQVERFGDFPLCRLCFENAMTPIYYRPGTNPGTLSPREKNIQSANVWGPGDFQSWFRRG